MLRNKKFFLDLSKTLRRYSITASLKEVEIKNNENVILENETNETNAALQHPDYFNVQELFTIKDLFDHRVHYGHKITSLNPKMKQYLFGSRLGHLIFDLNITAAHLTKALNFTAHIAYQNGIILFVSKNSSFTLLVEKTALECKEFAVTREWKLGTFTNSKNLFQNVIRLPDLCIFLNIQEENGFQHQGVIESAKMLIPTVGIVDSNCDPNLITYPVPGNDDSIITISYFCELFKKAILKGKNKALEEKKNKKTEITNENTNTNTNPSDEGNEKL